VTVCRNSARARLFPVKLVFRARARRNPLATGISSCSSLGLRRQWRQRRVWSRPVVVVNHLDRRLWFDKCPYQATYPTKQGPARKKIQEKDGDLMRMLVPERRDGWDEIYCRPTGGWRSEFGAYRRIGVRSSVFWLLTTSH
jgi:hypothetical protein